MNRTSNYNLCQWEETDRVRRTDFNEDNVKLDAAIKAVDRRVDGLEGSKASVAALNSLQTAMRAKGNCQIVTGQYVGNGRYGSGAPNTLTFGKKPLFVAVGGTLIMIAVNGMAHAEVPSSNAAPTCIWSDTGVSWYDDEAWRQMNDLNKTYFYVALLEA